MKSTYPAPFLLCDVEIIENKEWTQVEAVVWGTVCSTMTMIVHIMISGVLELMDDDAGGGDTRTLEKSHQVDHEGTGELFDKWGSFLLDFTIFTVCNDVWRHLHDDCTSALEQSWFQVIGHTGSCDSRRWWFCNGQFYKGSHVLCAQYSYELSSHQCAAQIYHWHLRDNNLFFQKPLDEEYKKSLTARFF